MILNSTKVEQTIDGNERAWFYKDLIVARVRSVSAPEPIPLALVRKRDARAEGTRAPVLLIHGYGQNRYAWHLPARSMSAYLARAGYDVFNLDLRGHGRSRALGARRPSHVGDFVREDLPAAVEEVQRLSGGRPVFLVGHSLGGLISYAAAPALGASVAGIATLGSPYHFTRGSTTLEALGRLMLFVDRRVSLGTESLALRGPMRFARVLLASPILPLPLRGFDPASIEPSVIAQHMSLAMDHGSITVLRNMFLSAVESRHSGHRLGGLIGYAEAFEALDVPLLVIAGSRDDLAPPESVRPAYEWSHSRDRTYRVFPRGHMDILVGRDNPRTIWPLIEQWLGARVVRG